MCLGSYVSCECSGHLWAQVRQTYITVYIRMHAKSNTDMKLYKMINITTVSTGTTHKHWSCNSLLWIVVSHSFLFFFFLCFQLTTTVSVDYCCCGDTFVSLPFLNFVLWSVFISLYIRPEIQLPQIHEITGCCMCSQSRGKTSVNRISLLLSHAHTTGRYIHKSRVRHLLYLLLYYRNYYRRMSVWQPWMASILVCCQKKKRKKWDKNRFTWWPGRRSADYKLAWP